nr:PD-(D/E)XK nuclease family protein [Polaribacter marinus]
MASSSKLWNTEQGKAIDFGNLLHEIFAKINTKQDVDFVLSQYHQKGILNDLQMISVKRNIEEVVNHLELKTYFSKDVTVFNEREIIDVDNQIVIPDRLVLNSKNEVVIIDYKTGNPSKEHHQQLLKYERVLKTMGFKIIKKILIYINSKIDVVEV